MPDVRLHAPDSVAHEHFETDVATTVCPHCGLPVHHPGQTSLGAPLLAECDRCDIYFDPPPVIAATSQRRIPGRSASNSAA